MATEIRSYRAVFDLERRIYRVDRLRLNPGGVPVRGIVYFLALLAVMLLASALPLIGMLVRALPWYLRELALPAATASLLTLIKLEGRPFHLAGLALIRYGLGPRELAGLRPRIAADRRWRMDELLILVDGSDANLRRLRYIGPGAVHVRVAHTRTVWGSPRVAGFWRRADMRLAPLSGRPGPERGQVIELRRGARLEVSR